MILWQKTESLNNKQTLATDTWNLSKKSSKGSQVKKSCGRGNITEMLFSHTQKQIYVLQHIKICSANEVLCFIWILKFW